MKKRLIIIIIAVLVAAAALVVVIYRDSIFSVNETAKEVLVNEAEKEVAADEKMQVVLSDEDNPAFCEPAEAMPDAKLNKALDPSETALYSENILEMSLSKDGIPPIENPIYTSIEEADLYFED